MIKNLFLKNSIFSGLGLLSLLAPLVGISAMNEGQNLDLGADTFSRLLSTPLPTANSYIQPPPPAGLSAQFFLNPCGPFTCSSTLQSCSTLMNVRAERCENEKKFNQREAEKLELEKIFKKELLAAQSDPCSYLNFYFNSNNSMSVGYQFCSMRPEQCPSLDRRFDEVRKFILNRCQKEEQELILAAPCSTYLPCRMGGQGCQKLRAQAKSSCDKITTKKQENHFQLDCLVDASKTQGDPFAAITSGNINYRCKMTTLDMD